MPDYKASTIAGTSWQRACRVVIENSLNQTPSLMFVEESVVQLGDQVVTRPVANLSVQMDPQNPLHAEIYEKLNELYVLAREARDSQEA